MKGNDSDYFHKKTLAMLECGTSSLASLHEDDSWSLGSSPPARFDKTQSTTITQKDNYSEHMEKYKVSSRMRLEDLRYVSHQFPTLVEEQQIDEIFDDKDFIIGTGGGDMMRTAYSNNSNNNQKMQVTALLLAQQYSHDTKYQQKQHHEDDINNNKEKNYDNDNEEGEKDFHDEQYNFWSNDVVTEPVPFKPLSPFFKFSTTVKNQMIMETDIQVVNENEDKNTSLLQQRYVSCSKKLLFKSMNDVIPCRRKGCDCRPKAKKRSSSP